MNPFDSLWTWLLLVACWTLGTCAAGYRLGADAAREQEPVRVVRRACAAQDSKSCHDKRDTDESAEVGCGDCRQAAR